MAAAGTGVIVGSAIPFDDLVEVVFETVPDGDDLFSDIYLVAGDGVDMGKGDDERTVYADKFFGWQPVGKRLQIVQCQDGFRSSPDMYLCIIFHSLAEEDIFEFDLDD